MKKMLTWFLSISIVTLLVSCTTFSPQKVNEEYFSSWPNGTSPKEIGKRVAEHFVVTAHGGPGRTTPVKQIIYPETCTWYGAMTFARLTGDNDLKYGLFKRMEPLFTSQEANLIPVPDHVDNSVFGIVPFEIYIQNKDKRCLELAKGIADKQWENPTKEGLTTQTRFWIDDMFMITALQVQAFRATNDLKYIDRAALEMATYLDTLQKPNGLFYHAPDVPFFWGRGNGWVAAGMAELLSSLPMDNPKRERILDGYRKMMSSLLKYQDQNGMWHQLIDKPDISWAETSSTGMFTFAMITGVKNGWLDAEVYGPAARKGWLALIKYIDANSDIREVCEGTGKKNDQQYYLDRKRNVGDLHGQAPVLWCASALLR
jgi:unsaturated rhamnogalacturonyl hydrolase